MTKIKRKTSAKKTVRRTTRKNTTRKGAERRPLSWAEWGLIGIVALAGAMILVALIGGFFCAPSLRAERKLNQIADDYYIEYLYPRIVENNFENPGEKLAKYVESGAPTVYLRQLLHFKDDEKLAKVFDEAECDTNSTSVRFYPVEPYGPRDYTVQTKMFCATIE